MLAPPPIGLVVNINGCPGVFTLKLYVTPRTKVNSRPCLPSIAKPIDEPVPKYGWVASLVAVVMDIVGPPQVYVSEPAPPVTTGISVPQTVPVEMEVDVATQGATTVKLLTAEVVPSVAVTLCGPFVNVRLVQIQLPEGVAATVTHDCPLGAVTVTVEPGVAVPVMGGFKLATVVPLAGPDMAIGLLHTFI